MSHEEDISAIQFSSKLMIKLLSWRCISTPAVFSAFYDPVGTSPSLPTQHVYRHFNIVHSATSHPSGSSRLDAGAFLSTPKRDNIFPFRQPYNSLIHDCARTHAIQKTLSTFPYLCGFISASPEPICLLTPAAARLPSGRTPERAVPTAQLAPGPAPGGLCWARAAAAARPAPQAPPPPAPAPASPPATGRLSLI